MERIAQLNLALERVPADSIERHDLGEDCWIELHHDFAADDHEARMQALVAALPWLQELYLRGGRAQPAPRLTSFHGDPGCGYTYSGIAYEPAPWTDELSLLRARCEARSGVAFNCVLCNLYRDGRDSVGWHADDEPELGPSDDDIAIGSVSLGAPRRFVLKHRRDGRRLAFELGHGSLFLMRGRTQRLWLHSLPKTQKACEPRLNLTFRVVRSGISGA
jgi:alkylated DNA repair dioxygenase AlkB